MKCLDPEYKPEEYTMGPRYEWVQNPPKCPCQICSDKWNDMMAMSYGYGGSHYST